MRDVGLDQHSGFALADEWRGCCDDSFSSRDAHTVEEGSGEFSNSPLKPPPIVEQLHKSNEEDDWWDDAEDEPAKL